MITRLQTGFFNPTSEHPESTPSSLDRKALLVYAGTFESMEGFVEVKDEHITRLADNHNSFLSRVNRLASGDIPLKFCPPVQLDHSLSAKDTVGRLTGLLDVGDHEVEPGKKVKALYGTVRVLGKENVEKVIDGRWTNLSIGADLEGGKFSELTITPFPAAPDASMLSRMTTGEYHSRFDRIVKPQGAQSTTHSPSKCTAVFKDEESAQAAALLLEDDGYFKGVTIIKGSSGSFILSAEHAAPDGDRLSRMAGTRTETYKGKKIKITKGEGMDWYLEVGDIKRGPFQKEEDAYNEGVQVVESGVLNKFTKGEDMLTRFKAFVMRTLKLSAEDAEKKMAEMPEAEKAKMAEDEKKEHEKLKKHLMTHQKMTEEEAEKHLSDMNEADVKKLTAEADEQEKKLAADQPYAGKETPGEEALEPTHKMAKFMGEMTKLSADFRKASDAAKLAARRADISTKFSKLRSDAKITPAEIRKIDIAKLAAKNDETVAAVLESYSSRESVILTGLLGSSHEANVSEAYKAARMSKLEAEVRANMPLLARAKSTNLAAEPVVKEEKMAAHEPDMEAEMMAVHKLLDEGKIPEAKERMKLWVGKHMSPAGQHQGDVQAEMSALAGSVKCMQNEFDKVMKLIGSMAGSN